GCPTGISGITSCSATLYANPDFTLSASPAQLTIIAGNPGTSTVTLSSQGGFGGPIAMSATTPAGITCTLSPTTVTLISPVVSSNGQTATATLSCTSNTANNYSVTVTGSGVTISHSVTVTVSVPDFSISANPTTTVVNVGSSAASTITIAALGGFVGPVALTDTIPSGLTCGAITPGSVSGSGTATVSCSATLEGNYALTITGTSGSLAHSVTVTFTFVDFSVSANPSPMGVPKGSSGSSTITITGSNSFTGSVSVSASVPSGLTASFSSSSVMLNPSV